MAFKSEVSRAGGKPDTKSPSGYATSARGPIGPRESGEDMRGDEMRPMKGSTGGGPSAAKPGGYDVSRGSGYNKPSDRRDMGYAPDEAYQGTGHRPGR